MKNGISYTWEIGMEEGLLRKQYDENGYETTLPSIVPDKVLKVSFSASNGLPPHILTFDEELKFVRLFGRGFIKIGDTGPRAYAHCVVTNQFRFYLLQDGRVIITPKDYELRHV